MSFILRTKSSVDKSSVISLQPGGYLMPRGAAGMTVEPLPLRSEEHTSELQSRLHIVCRLLLEKKKNGEGGEDFRRVFRRAGGGHRVASRPGSRKGGVYERTMRGSGAADDYRRRSAMTRELLT